MAGQFLYLLTPNSLSSLMGTLLSPLHSPPTPAILDSAPDPKCTTSLPISKYAKHHHTHTMSVFHLETFIWQILFILEDPAECHLFLEVSLALSEHNEFSLLCILTLIILCIIVASLGVYLDRWERQKSRDSLYFCIFKI